VTSFLDAAQRLALRIGARGWLLGVGGAIALLGGIGIVRFAYKEELRLFNLDGERNFPTVFTAFLLLVVSVLAWVVGRASEGRPAVGWKMLAALMVLLAGDELVELHEHLEFYAGINWKILYAPVVLVAVTLWVVLGRQLRALGAGFAPFVAAPMCVLVASVVDDLEIDSEGNPRRGFRVMVVSEEVLEMTFGLLVGLSLIAALRALTGRASTTAA
jgi:hypothetical protein